MKQIPVPPKLSYYKIAPGSCLDNIQSLYGGHTKSKVLNQPERCYWLHQSQNLNFKLDFSRLYGGPARIPDSDTVLAAYSIRFNWYGVVSRIRSGLKCLFFRKQILLWQNFVRFGTGRIIVISVWVTHGVDDFYFTWCVRCVVPRMCCCTTWCLVRELYVALFIAYHSSDVPMIEHTYTRVLSRRNKSWYMILLRII